MKGGNMNSKNKRLSEEIQEKMYKDRIEKIELWGGKSREELIKKANTLRTHRKTLKPMKTD